MGGIEIERKGEGEREKRRKIDRQDEVEDEGISRSPLHTGDSLFGTARLKSRPLGALRSGTTFVGTQKALGREPYSIKVTIHDVDLLVDDKISGYLECSGLLPEPVTTFFDGAITPRFRDIIGPKHTFRTLTAGKPPTEYVDLAHWSKFPAFRSRLISPQTHLLSNLPLSTEVVARDRYAPLYNTHKAHDPYTSDYIFMRWKEKFLVPDYKETISGASFCGWYYVCFRRSTGHISGFYYHANSELYQELELCMEEETGFGEFEWR
ncbi:hypothetical protein YB2330_001531 [Saitoella coloradoensis]